MCLLDTHHQSVHQLFFQAANQTLNLLTLPLISAQNYSSVQDQDEEAVGRNERDKSKLKEIELAARPVQNNESIVS